MTPHFTFAFFYLNQIMHDIYTIVFEIESQCFISQMIDFMYCHVVYPVMTSSYIFMLWIRGLQFDVRVPWAAGPSALSMR